MGVAKFADVINGSPLRCFSLLRLANMLDDIPVVPGLCKCAGIGNRIKDRCV